MVDDVEEPEHELPPLLGAGLVQDRDLCLLPDPQECEQLPHDPHADQLPSTANGSYRAAITKTTIRD